MSKRKPPTPCEEFAKRSRELRAKTAELLKELEHIAGQTQRDVITLGSVLAAEAEEWRSLTGTLNEEFERSSSKSEEERDALIEEFIDRFRMQLTDAGCSVYGEGALLIVDGVVHVDFDLPKGRVRVDGALQTDLSMTGLQATIEECLNGLKKTITPAPEFLARLLRAYETVIGSTGAGFGSQLHTMDLLPALLMQRQTPRFLADPSTETFIGYPAAQFRADLHGLLQSGHADVDATTFHWAPGSNTKGAVFMLVPALQRATHVARVWFDRKGNQE